MTVEYEIIYLMRWASLDQNLDSRYIVTGITSQEQIFDISTTIHSILGLFFPKDIVCPHILSSLL